MSINARHWLWNVPELQNESQNRREDFVRFDRKSLCRGLKTNSSSNNDVQRVLKKNRTIVTVTMVTTRQRAFATGCSFDAAHFRYQGSQTSRTV